MASRDPQTGWSQRPVIPLLYDNISKLQILISLNLFVNLVESIFEPPKYWLPLRNKSSGSITCQICQIWQNKNRPINRPFIHSNLVHRPLLFLLLLTCNADCRSTEALDQMEASHCSGKH